MERRWAGLVDLGPFRAWQLRRLGLDYYAGPPDAWTRAHGLPKGEVFPGEDVLDDAHATAQAVWDIRRPSGWIWSRSPSR